MVDFSMAISVDRSVILGETARSKSTVVPNQRNTSQFTAKRIEMSEPTVDGPLMAVQIYNTQGVNCMCIYIYIPGDLFSRKFLVVLALQWFQSFQDFDLVFHRETLPKKPTPTATHLHEQDDFHRHHCRFLVERCLSWMLYMPKDFFMVDTLMVAPWLLLEHLEILPMKSSSLQVQVAMGDIARRPFWPCSCINKPISTIIWTLGRTLKSFFPWPWAKEASWRYPSLDGTKSIQ